MKFLRFLSSAKPPFSKILIANRGEIAIRIIKTCEKMGIKTVSVHSTPDQTSQFVKASSESFHIGPAQSSLSYLNIDKIIDVVKKSGAEAVHPGYGFLSENAEFVKRLESEGVVFIGPSSQSMADMGDKIRSKIVAKAAGVNIVPGVEGEIVTADDAVAAAKIIGYPVMVKASAGGGGKGMRIAYTDAELRESFRLSKQEAKSSFGDDRMLVEKYIESPRHIEIQLIGDKHGNTRECSIQRRNQKVIEEAPSIHIDPETRRMMGEQAVRLAKNVGYFSAGTCEFLVDPKRNFYFLEMNTRLQVEHPITEYITGLDLVELMIRVAAGEKLLLNQDDLSKPKGWAFESRVYAEDPEKYLPSIGRLTTYIEPVQKSFYPPNTSIRIDSGITEGSEISMYYDPLISKLVTHGDNRDDARNAMIRALDSYVIKGVTHNTPLLRDVLNQEVFIDGRKVSTAFLKNVYPKGFKGADLGDGKCMKSKTLLGTVAVIQSLRDLRNKRFLEGLGNMKAIVPTVWENIVSVVATAGSPTSGISENVKVKKANDNSWEVTVDGVTMQLNLDWDLESPLIECVIDNEVSVLQYLEPLALGYRIQYLGTRYDVQVLSLNQHELSKYMKPKAKLDLTSVVLSPMPGAIVSIAIKEGDIVAEGSEMGVVEAMKMQNVIRSPRAGRVKKVFVKSGQSVGGDEIMFELEKEEKRKE